MTTRTAELITKSSKIFENMGLSTSEAIDMFLEKVIKTNTVPIEAITLENIPNAETLEAMAESEEMENNPEKYKRYSSVEEIFKDLGL